MDKTLSFEYQRNECCHKILNTLHHRLSPIMREGIIGDFNKGIKGKITSNSLFAWVDISDLVTELNEPDHVILDCCEHLWRNNHVDVLRKNIRPDQKDSGVIYQISFTKPGLDAYKTDFYFKENQKQDWATQIHNSTLLNNKLTPIIAALAFVLSLFTFIKDLKERKELSVSQQQFQSQLQSIDSLHQVEITALHLLLTKFQKDVSYINTPKQNDTTHKSQ